MVNISIRNQEDFNRIYPTLPVRDRGMLGRAYPEYYNTYMDTITSNYQSAMREKKEQKIKEAERKVDEANQRKVRQDYLKAIAGKENDTFKPIKDQATRNKIAQYEKNKAKANQVKAQPSSNYTAIQQMIINKALQKGIDPALALALVQRESNFNPNAIGDSGKSFGLFQIHTPDHPGYKGGLNPEANAEYGLNLLKSHLDRYGGDIDKALWAYNAGSGNLQKGILPASTKAYIANIKSNMGKFGSPQAGDYNLPQTPTEQILQAPKINLDEFNQALNNIYSSQNGQQGGLNLNQDNLYLNNIQPLLTGQEIASNLENKNPATDYFKGANQFYKNTYDLARQAGGYGLEEPKVEQPKGQDIMMNYNNYLPIRGYANIDNQLAPVPNTIGDIRGYANVTQPQVQAQNIREDVLGDYIKLIESLKGQGETQNQALMAQLQQATKADAMQNFANQMNNANQYQIKKAPIYYVGANGNLNAIEQDQIVTPPRQLPTNTTANVDAFKNQLALQAKAQQNNKDLIDAYRSVIAGKSMSDVTGLPEGVFLEPDFYKTYAQYIQNPEVSQHAQFKREAGMAPIDLSSKMAIESLKNSGELDKANLQGQYDLGKANLAGQYMLANSGMQGANQQAINRANLMAKLAIANMDNETKLRVAQQAGANALQLAELSDALYSKNEVRIKNADAQLTGAMANLFTVAGTPEQGFALYNQIINMNNPNNLGQVNNTGNLSPDLWE